MFEDMTYENILEEMLDMVENDVDKREGSILYDALAPAAFKLAEAYYQLSNYGDLFFIDTTVGEYLDRKALDYGMTRKPSTSSVRQVITTGEVNVGTRWGINDLIYVIDKKLSENTYQAICQTKGEVGNVYRGELDNIDNVGEVTATLTDILEYGSEEESDDKLRERIQQQIIRPAQDGNQAQYLKWAHDYPGVGAAKVFPLWQGSNTVKVVITNSAYQPAESLLISNLQNYIDPGSSGLGNGVAPIGSKVTVTSGTKKAINVEANVTLRDGYSGATGVSEALTDYLKELTFNKDKVSYMRIGSIILDCDSILDISNLKVNSGTVDITLGAEDIPVLGTLNLVVSEE